MIARTGELLIERYQLYVQLPRERRPKARGGGREGARLTDGNLNPSTRVSREGVLRNDDSLQIEINQNNLTAA